MSAILAEQIVRTGPIAAILNDPERIAEVRRGVMEGNAYIVNSGVAKPTLMAIRDYLASIGRGSIPQYHPIEFGAPNFHRVNRWDERSYVKGCFHQFSFFPWNDDIFGLFDLFRPAFRLKNAISGLPQEAFLGREPTDGCTARISFQFYPKGQGAMNRHADPVDRHQLTVPALCMSRKGEDYSTGGTFVEDKRGQRICLDDECDWGDVAYFNAQVVHGVEMIDKGSDEPWSNFSGRWVAILAVNKLASNREIGNSLDLDS